MDKMQYVPHNCLLPENHLVSNSIHFDHKRYSILLVKYGNAVASLCVERRGVIPAMPTVEEIKERIIQ